MTTKRYLSDIAFTAASGTLPSAEQDAQSPSFTATGATTLKALVADKTSSMVGLSAATLASTSAQAGFMGMWALSALSGAQTVGGTGETLTINIADRESNLNANFCINRAHVYVWRPSNNSKVGDCCSYSTTPSSGSPTEPTAADSTQVTSFVVDLSSVSASDGDVIIVELWASFTQSAATSYTVGLYYGGATEETVENTVVTDHAAFLEFSQTFTLTSIDARLTSQSAKVVYSEPTTSPEARLTSQSIAAIYSEPVQSPEARLTRQSILVVYEVMSSIVRTTSLQAEVLATETPEPMAQTSSIQLEVLSYNDDVTKRPRTFVVT